MHSNWCTFKVLALRLEIKCMDCGGANKQPHHRYMFHTVFTPPWMARTDGRATSYADPPTRLECSLHVAFLTCDGFCAATGSCWKD